MIPNMIASAIKSGIEIIIATNLGTTTYPVGLTPIVFRASICSVTFIVPISAAIEAPTLPASMSPTRTGPSSLQIAIETNPPIPDSKSSFVAW